MEEKMYNIKFRYADILSNFEWRNQQCSLYASSQREAVNKCKKLYGLGVDCEYEMITVEEER